MNTGARLGTRQTLITREVRIISSCSPLLTLTVKFALHPTARQIVVVIIGDIKRLVIESSEDLLFGSAHHDRQRTYHEHDG